MFDEPVADLSVLSDCLFVQSNLNLAPSAVVSVATGRLTRIEGDVILANIPPERLAFLKKTTLNGTISSDVCNFPPLNGKAVKSPVCPLPTTGPTTTTTTEQPTNPTLPSSGYGSSNSIQDPAASSKQDSDGRSDLQFFNRTRIYQYLIKNSKRF